MCLDESNDEEPIADAPVTSTGVIDKDGPKSVLTPLEDAPTDEMVCIAGTGTTDAATDLLAIDTEIGTFGCGRLLTLGTWWWFRPAAIEEFGISSTVVEELLWFEMAKIGAETCSDALLMMGGVDKIGVDVFTFASFNTQEGGMEFCVAFTKRLGLSG